MRAARSIGGLSTQQRWRLAREPPAVAEAEANRLARLGNFYPA